MKTSQNTKRRKAYQTILWELNGAKEALEARLEDESAILEDLRSRHAAPERIDAGATLCDSLETVLDRLDAAIYKLEAATKCRIEEDVRRGW